MFTANTFAPHQAVWQASACVAFTEQLTSKLPSQPSLLPLLRGHLVEKKKRKKKVTEGSRKFKMCGKTTPFICEACKVPLCVIVDRNCHKSLNSALL